MLMVQYKYYKLPSRYYKYQYVTIPPCPPSNIAENGSIAALKRHAHDFVHQQATRDDAGLSYLESADTYEYDTLAIRRMIVQ
jgi:hypothetical protein